MKNKSLMSFGLLALLALSNTSFFGKVNSEHNLTLASRLPPMKLIADKDIERLDLCGEALDQTLNEKVDLMKLFIATAEITSDQIGESVQKKDQVFQEKLKSNLGELEKKGFDQVEMMAAGDEGVTFCLPKLLDLAMGDGSRSYLSYNEKLHRLTNYLGQQGVTVPEKVATQLLFLDKKVSN